MMLDEMKNNELNDEEGVARPTIQNIEDSIEFQATTNRDKINEGSNVAHLRASY